jgi:hypothetical protein
VWAHARWCRFSAAVSCLAAKLNHIIGRLFSHYPPPFAARANFRVERISRHRKARAYERLTERTSLPDRARSLGARSTDATMVRMLRYLGATQEQIAHYEDIRRRWGQGFRASSVPNLHSGVTQLIRRPMLLYEREARGTNREHGSKNVEVQHSASNVFRTLRGGSTGESNGKATNQKAAIRRVHGRQPGCPHGSPSFER